MVIKAVITALLGMVGIGGSTTGYFVTRGRWYERILLFLAGISLIDPGTTTDIFGFSLLAIVWLLQKQRKRREKNATATA